MTEKEFVKVVVSPAGNATVTTRMRVVVECDSTEQADRLAASIVQFQPCSVEQYVQVKTPDNLPLGVPIVTHRTNYTLKPTTNVPS